MGGNSVVNAAARMGGVKGVALIAPCDIGFMSEQMRRDELTRFLIGEGLHVLHRASDEAVVADIERTAASMRFSHAARSLAGVEVFLATGEYDAVVPTKPLDMFWDALPNDGALRIRKSYRATHSLMGCRRALARDLVEFIRFHARIRQLAGT